jgi:hypothetical protein
LSSASISSWEAIFVIGGEIKGTEAQMHAAALRAISC